MNPKKSENWMKNDLEYNADFDYVCLFSMEYRVRKVAWPKTQITTENKIFIKPYIRNKNKHVTLEMNSRVRKKK